MLRDAIAQFQAGRLEKAAEVCRRILIGNDRDAEANHLLGVIHIRARRPQEAVLAIKKAVESAPGVPTYENSLGAAFAESGMHAQAVHHFHKALALQPHSLDAHRNLANSLLRIGYPQEAIGHLERAIGIDPSGLDLYVQMGRALAALGRHAEAAAWLRRAPGGKAEDGGKQRAESREQRAGGQPKTDNRQLRTDNRQLRTAHCLPPTACRLLCEPRTEGSRERRAERREPTGRRWTRRRGDAATRGPKTEN